MSRIKHPQRRRKKANRIFRKRRKVFFEPLEPRLLLSETFSFAAATAAAGMDMTLKLTDDVAGLAGMCDLVATCISHQSRNRYVGEQLGRGRSLDEIIEEMNQVAEGVKSAPVVARLGRDLGVELPIADEICAVIQEGRSATEAYRGLVRRPATRESDIG